MIKEEQRFLNFVFVLLDCITLVAAYFVSYFIKFGFSSLDQYQYLYLRAPLWMVPLLVVFYFFTEVYSPMRNKLFRKEMLLVIRAHIMGMIAIYGLLYLMKAYIYSRIVLFSFGILGVFAVLIMRYTARRTIRFLRSKGYNQKHLLIIGAGKVGINFAKKVANQKEFGYNIIGFLDDNPSKKGEQENGFKVLDDCSNLPQLLATNSVDEVVVALPLSAYTKYHAIVNDCESEGIRVRIIPDYFDYLPGKPKIEEFDEIPVLNVRYVPLDDPFNRFIKRIFDILVSLFAVLLTSPAMIVIAILIKITSPGPILYRQERIGLNNKPFYMLKFRSMKLATDSSGDTKWTTADDPRKTWIGNFIRKTSLDELPQFLNVLKGDMSVVGPRPERPFFVEQFKEKIPKYMVKHQVKPGITGWAQVNGWRGDTSIEKRIECDIYYIENWDALFDIKIMFLTVFKGLINKNAY